MSTGGTIALALEDGVWAVDFARRVVESVVETGTETVTADGPPVLGEDRGAFVTLERGGSLRGCIGRPEPRQTGVQAIREAATGAVKNDPRFPPVRPDELDAITVEVSVLTPPDPIEESDPNIIPEEITIGRDGLIVQGDSRSGLLLPQVPVDRGWEPSTFLDQTCSKAGLPAGYWRSGDVRIERFTAQVFAESEPRGQVEAVQLTPAQN